MILMLTSTRCLNVLVRTNNNHYNFCNVIYSASLIIMLTNTRCRFTNRVNLMTAFTNPSAVKNIIFTNSNWKMWCGTILLIPKFDPKWKNCFKDVTKFEFDYLQFQSKHLYAWDNECVCRFSKVDFIDCNIDLVC